MMSSRQEIHRVFHRFPRAARTWSSNITSWTKVTCHPHFFKHHNMRERMLDANPYKLCISHIQEKSATTYAVSICFCCHQMWRFAYSSKTIRTGQSRADCTDFTIMRGENKHFWVSSFVSICVSCDFGTPNGLYPDCPWQQCQFCHSEVMKTAWKLTLWRSQHVVT